MSAEVLRQAATRVRHDVEFGQAHGDDSFLLAVADWLEQMARGMAGTSYGDLPFEDAALAVARAYLGSDA